MANKLQNVTVNEVSVVGKAANGRVFLLAKSADGAKKDPVKVAKNDPASDNQKEPGVAKKALIALAKALGFDDALAVEQEQQQEWALNCALWDGLDALNVSIQSIRQDDTVTDKYGAVLAAMQEFAGYLKDSQVIKAGKKISGERMGKLKDLHSQLGDLISGADDDPEEAADGGTQNMEGSVGKMADNKFPDGHPDGCMCDKCVGIRADAAKKSADGAKKGVNDDFTKGLPDEIKKGFEALTKRCEGLEAINKTLQESIEKRDSADKETAIKKKFDGITMAIDLDAMMPVLKGLKDEELDKYVATIKAADEQVKKGDLFKEHGTSGVGETDVEKRIDAAAQELRKSDSKLTKEQAFAKALEANPKLYEEYMGGVK